MATKMARAAMPPTTPNAMLVVLDEDDFVDVSVGFVGEEPVVLDSPFDVVDTAIEPLFGAVIDVGSLVGAVVDAGTFAGRAVYPFEVQ
jgi:hypothetical protein